VFLQVKVKRSSLRLGRYPNFPARYCGTFEILENIVLVGYILALSASMRVHNLFLVSLLKKYVPKPSHIIDWTIIQVEHEGDFRVEPMRILDRKVKMFKKKDIILVKVQWTFYAPEDVMWEYEETM